MSRTTIAGAATELFALLADTDGNPVSSLLSAGCVKVYPFEPGAGAVVKPCAVTLMFSGWTPTDWKFAVRVYVADLPHTTAQDTIASVVAAVSALLKSGAAWGPDEGEVQWVDELGCWIAGGETMVGREDGF